MARYSAFLGRRVGVQYRAGDILLLAAGTCVADSGRSIFLEQSYEQRGQRRHFRWEIPYQCIVRLAEQSLPQAASPASAGAAPDQPSTATEIANEPASDKEPRNASGAAAGLGHGGAPAILGPNSQKMA